MSLLSTAIQVGSSREHNPHILRSSDKLFFLNFLVLFEGFHSSSSSTTHVLLSYLEFSWLFITSNDNEDPDDIIYIFVL